MADVETTDNPTTAALAGQSLANSVAIAVSDATTALRNVQAIMTTVQSVAMSRWLASGERDEAAQQIVHTATQITRDAVRLWQEVQATAQALLDGRDKDADDRREGGNASEEEKPVARKAAKKAGRKPAKARVAKRTAAKKASRKPAKPTPAAKKAPAKRAKPAKGAGKPRKTRTPKPAAAPPPTDDAPPTDES